MGDLWCLGTWCAYNNNLSGKKSLVLLLWMLSVQFRLKEPAYIDQNNRAEKDQSKTVKNGHWSGWMDMDETVNSSTGLQPRCLYPETDVTLNPSLTREMDAYIFKGAQISPPIWHHVSLFFHGNIDSKTSRIISLSALTVTKRCSQNL